MYRLILTLLFSLPPSLASAQWPALNDVPNVESTRTTDVAVIVAVEDYLLLPDIDGAVSNANEWENFFHNALEIPTVHVLTNQDASREEMLKFAKLAADDVGENGRIWWVFIGHGAPSVNGEDGLLVGMDAQQTIDSLNARSVSQSELLKTLNATTNESVVILDACFSGRSQDGETLVPGAQPVIAIDPTSNVGTKSIIFSAAKSTQFAGRLDGTERPAFSYLMLGALRGWAAGDDDIVTAKEALMYSQRQLRGAKGRIQTPQMTGALKLVLTRGVDEKEPKAIQNGVENADCDDGQTRVAGECRVEKKTAVAYKKSEAERTLDYLQLRISWDGDDPKQAGKHLKGPAFYHAINRPDLADKWLGHRPWLWGTGLAVLAVGGVILGLGVGNVDSANGLLWFIGGSLLGSFAIIGGSTMVIFGLVGNREPMSISQRRGAASKFNTHEREKRGLSREVEFHNSQRSNGSIFKTMSGLKLESPKFGFTVRF